MQKNKPTHNSSGSLIWICSSQNLLNYLHQQSAEIITAAKIWFSKDMPCTDVRCLLGRPIPSKVFLAALNKIFGQAWLNGSKYIINWRYNDGRDRLPPWTLTFCQWQRLRRLPRSMSHGRGALAGSIPKWRSRIKIQSRTRYDLHNRSYQSWVGHQNELLAKRGFISVLSALLSTVWLSDEHINLMMEELAARLAADPDTASKVIIASLAFQIQINNAKVKTYKK